MSQLEEKENHWNKKQKTSNFPVGKTQTYNQQTPN